MNHNTNFFKNLAILKLFIEFSIIIGAEHGGAAGAQCTAHAPPLFTPRPEIYSIYVFGGENSPKFPVVHLHYLQHFGASENGKINKAF